jgi:hypothetical protein
MIKLDKGHFGNSPAAVTLSNIINDNQLGYHSKISRMLTNYNRILNELKKTHTEVSVGLVQMVYKNYSESADKLPDDVRTFVHNLLTAKYRIWMVENGGHITKKRRIK